jgi:hypothetical protein
VPPQLTPQQRTAYRAVFDDIAAANWTGAAARLDAMGDGPLHDIIRAQLFTLPGTPPVELGRWWRCSARRRSCRRRRRWPALPSAAARPHCLSFRSRSG